MYSQIEAPHVGQLYQHNIGLQKAISDCLYDYLSKYYLIKNEPQLGINRYIRMLLKQVHQTKMESTLVNIILVKTYSQYWQRDVGLKKLADKLRRDCEVRQLSNVYDVRGNSYQYTLRESQWAMATFPLLQTHHMKLLKHATRLISNEIFGDDIMELVRFHDETKGDLEIRVARIMSSEQIFTILPKTFADLKGKNINTLFHYMRSKDCFEYRGRVELSVRTRLERISSAENLMAGIAQAEITQSQPTLRDAFPEPHYHAKNDYSRRGMAEHETDEFFRKRNIPFITGASGTLAYVLALYIKGDFFTKQQLEVFVLFHAASLIYLGHHSLLEIVIVAQSVFLFDALPNIAESIAHPGFYQEFIRQLSDYMTRVLQLPGV